MEIVIDIETASLFKTSKILGSKETPRMVEIAWVLLSNTDRTIPPIQSYLIKPNGFRISEDAFAVHKISQEMAMRLGEPVAVVLEQFLASLKLADRIVAHNVSFDLSILTAEFNRLGVNIDLKLKQVCTMYAGKNLCKLKYKYGYKFPTLTELYVFLFGKKPELVHRASDDVRCCAEIFLELKKRGVVKS